MCMLRESRREGSPWEDQAVDVLAFRVRGASGRTTEEEAGLGVIALEESEDARGLSDSRVLCRRSEAGLIEDALEAACNAGEEEE